MPSHIQSQPGDLVVPYQEKMIHSHYVGKSQVSGNFPKSPSCIPYLTDWMAGEREV